MAQYLRSIARMFGVSLVGAALTALLPCVANADSVLGAWTTQDGHGVVAIEPCGDAVCGRIVGIDRAPGEPIPKDVHGASQCGLTIITRQKPTGDGTWLGQVIDPRSGTAYGAKIWVDNRGNLHLRGFLGLPLFGQTVTWRPYTGRLTPACELT